MTLPPLREGERIVGTMKWRPSHEDVWRDGWLALPVGATDAEAMRLASAAPHELLPYLRSR